MIIHIKLVPVNKCEECHKRSLKEIIFQAIKQLKDKIKKKEYDVNFCDFHYQVAIKTIDEINRNQHKRK